MSGTVTESLLAVLSGPAAELEEGAGMFINEETAETRRDQACLRRPQFLVLDDGFRFNEIR